MSFPPAPIVSQHLPERVPAEPAHHPRDDTRLPGDFRPGRPASVSKTGTKHDNPAEHAGAAKLCRAILTGEIAKDLLEAPEPECPGHLLEDLIDVGAPEDILLRIGLPEPVVSPNAVPLLQQVVSVPLFLI